jgi:competence protein ComEA
MKSKIAGLLVLVLVLFSLNQLGFAQASAPAKETGKTVNINTAGQAELEQLPGIGPSLAKKILDFRQKNGQFKTPNDLMAVPGIGEKKFEQLKNLITVK